MVPDFTSPKLQILPNALLITAAQQIVREIPLITSGEQVAGTLQTAFSITSPSNLLDFEVSEKIRLEPESPLRTALLQFVKSASRFVHFSGAPKKEQDLDREIVTNLLPLLEVTESLSRLVTTRFFATNNSYELHEAIARLCNHTNSYIHAAEIAERSQNLNALVLGNETIRSRKDCLEALRVMAEHIVLQENLPSNDRRRMLATPLRLIGLFGTQGFDVLMTHNSQAALSGDSECAGIVKNLVLDSFLGLLMAEPARWKDFSSSRDIRREIYDFSQMCFAEVVATLPPYDPSVRISWGRKPVIKEYEGGILEQSLRCILLLDPQGKDATPTKENLMLAEGHTGIVTRVMEDYERSREKSPQKFNCEPLF